MGRILYGAMSDFSPPPLPPEPPPPPPLPPSLPPQPPRSGGGIPWDERDRIGFVTALTETLRRVLMEPVDFFRAMPVTGGLGSPLTFGLLVGYFGLAISAFYQALFQSLGGGMMGGLRRGSGEMSRYLEMFGGLMGFVITLVIGPVLLLFALFIGSGITHLMLMLLGSAKQGFEATFRVGCFAQSAAVFAVVPFCGGLAQGIYQIVLVIVGLAQAHKISYGMAALAVFLPLLLVCCCCAVAAGAMFGGLAGMTGLPQ
jgi:hypothetical protein